MPITRARILGLKPGPFADGIVAREVMGWRMLDKAGELWDCGEGLTRAYTGPAGQMPRTPHRVFRPWSDIRDAMEVLCKVRGESGRFIIRSAEGGWYWCDLILSDGETGMRGETICEAICRTALLAKMAGG